MIEHVPNSSYSFIPSPRVRVVQSKTTCSYGVDVSQVTEICWLLVTAAQPCLFLTDTSQPLFPFHIPRNPCFSSFFFFFVLEDFSHVRSILGTTLLPQSQALASWSPSLQNVRFRSILCLSRVHNGTRPFVSITTFSCLTFPLPISLLCR